MGSDGIAEQERHGSRPELEVEAAAIKTKYLGCHVYMTVTNQGSPTKLTLNLLVPKSQSQELWIWLQKEEEEAMAMKAAASACKIGGRQRNPSLSSIPLSLQQLKVHQIHHPQRFISAPIHQHGFKSSTRAISGTTADPMTPKTKNDQEQTPQNWKIKMLFDGDCPLCMREVDMLRERNKRYGTIKFVDISSDDYSPEENQGLDYKTVMGNIHAILSDGTVATDVEAFRKLYEQVGLGWVYAITKYEPIATIAGAVYGVWAKYRLQITGRPPLEEVLELRKKNKGEVCKDPKDCKLPE